MKISRMIAKWVSSISLLLLCVLPQACSTTENPVEPQPVSSGTLEVTITVTGTRPDPDGYAVAVSVGTQGGGDLPLQTVESIGGTVRFPDLPPGTHSVRLEALAADCSLEGANPRQFTIVAGGTIQIGFAVSCLGPGAVLVKTVTTGDDLDPDGYTIAFEALPTREEQIGANDSLLIREEDLPPAASWSVRLNGIAANCRIASPNPLTLRLAGDATTRIEFSVECTQRIAFGAAGIYIANSDGSATTRLTSGNSPAWSPDGQRIAFDRRGEIYIINADGSNETSLTQGVNPDWSPDGTRIVFADDGIYVMDTDGSDVTRLISGDFVDGVGVSKPAWSSDGRRIAFEHHGDGDLTPGQIYVMNANGSEPRRLTLTKGIQYAESDPAWSPDGSRIAFSSYGYGLATVGANGGFPISVYRNGGADPDWSPDGGKIVFTANRYGDMTGPSIYAVASGGGPPQLLIPDGYDPAWSPDGASIAFVHGDPDQ